MELLAEKEEKTSRNLEYENSRLAIHLDALLLACTCHRRRRRRKKSLFRVVVVVVSRIARLILRDPMHTALLCHTSRQKKKIKRARLFISRSLFASRLPLFAFPFGHNSAAHAIVMCVPYNVLQFGEFSEEKLRNLEVSLYFFVLLEPRRQYKGNETKNILSCLRSDSSAFLEKKSPSTAKKGESIFDPNFFAKRSEEERILRIPWSHVQDSPPRRDQQLQKTSSTHPGGNQPTKPAAKHLYPLFSSALSLPFSERC